MIWGRRLKMAIRPLRLKIWIGGASTSTLSRSKWRRRTMGPSETASELSRRAKRHSNSRWKVKDALIFSARKKRTTSRRIRAVPTIAVHCWQMRIWLKFAKSTTWAVVRSTQLSRSLLRCAWCQMPGANSIRLSSQPQSLARSRLVSTSTTLFRIVFSSGVPWSTSRDES